MALDLRKLKNVKERAEKIYARCPACEELGRDKKGNHLCVFKNGAFNCVAFGKDAEHNKRIYELAGTHGQTFSARPRTVPWVQKVQAKSAPALPALRKFKPQDCLDLCRIRGWPVYAHAGIELLCERGLLCYANVYDFHRTWPSWVITDSTRRGVQAKRLDGGNWLGIGGAKIKSLPGRSSAWPIGAVDIQDRPIVMLCEGQPDFVAALSVAAFERMPVDQIAPVCIAGAGNRIHEDALRFFEKKRVRIFAHPDDAGQKAAPRWAAQLLEVGATVDHFTFDGIALKNGKAVKDLAEYLMFLGDIRPVSTHVLRDLWCGPDAPEYHPKYEFNQCH